MYQQIFAANSDTCTYLWRQSCRPRLTPWSVHSTFKDVSLSLSCRRSLKWHRIENSREQLSEGQTPGRRHSNKSEDRHENPATSPVLSFTDAGLFEQYASIQVASSERAESTCRVSSCVCVSVTGSGLHTQMKEACLTNCRCRAGWTGKATSLLSWRWNFRRHLVDRFKTENGKQN